MSVDDGGWWMMTEVAGDVEGWVMIMVMMDGMWTLVMKSADESIHHRKMTTVLAGQGEIGWMGREELEGTHGIRGEGRSGLERKRELQG